MLFTGELLGSPQRGKRTEQDARSARAGALDQRPAAPQPQPLPVSREAGPTRTVIAGPGDRGQGPCALAGLREQRAPRGDVCVAGTYACRS